MNLRPCLAPILWLSALTAASATRADFETIANPGDAYPTGGTYVTATTLIPITEPQFTDITSLTDGTVTVGFSGPMTVLDVPDGFSTWGSPPFTESDTPIVLYTGGPSTRILSFSQELLGFGFELQPNPFGPTIFTVTFFNGLNEVGSIIRSADGDSGARLFAAEATGATPGFTSVLISGGGNDFAIAQLRYVAQAVPEPSSLALVAIGGLGLIVTARRAGREIRST